MKYDVGVIGYGPAGISAVSNLLEHKGEFRCVIFEAGKESDVCAKDDCMNLNSCGLRECEAISGKGGSIQTNNSMKVSHFPSGKKLLSLIQDSSIDDTKKKVQQILGEPDVIYDNRKLEIRPSVGTIRNGYRIDLYGADALGIFIDKNYKNARDDERFDFYFENRIVSVSKEDDYFIISDTQGNKFFCEHVLIATGRNGCDFSNQLIDEMNLKKKDSLNSIGFRFELPNKYIKEIANLNPDLKVKGMRFGQYTYKTFCFCAGENGSIVRKINYPSFVSIDGIVKDRKNRESEYGNFAILTNSDKFKDLVAEGYLDKLYKYSYRDFVTCIKDDTYPVRLLEKEQLIGYIMAYNNIVDLFVDYSGGKYNKEEIFDNTYIYGVEVQMLWNTVTLNKSLESSSQNLYFIGDCGAIAQGLYQACISGVHASNSIIEKVMFVGESYE